MKKRKDCSSRCILCVFLFIVTHTGYSHSNIAFNLICLSYLYDLVLGKQGMHLQFLQFCEHVRVSIQYFASSVLIRTCANFCTGLLGTHTKPRDHTSCELRVFAKLFFVFISLLTIRMRYSISIFIRTFISDYPFLFTGTQIALW